MTNQNMYGNPEITGQIQTFSVNVPKLWSIMTYQGKRHAVVQTCSYQGEAGEFTHKVQILPITEEGRDLGESPIWVQLTEFGLFV